VNLCLSLITLQGVKDDGVSIVLTIPCPGADNPDRPPFERTYKLLNDLVAPGILSTWQLIGWLDFAFDVAVGVRVAIRVPKEAVITWGWFDM